jgi:hypothetical protein
VAAMAVVAAANAVVDVAIMAAAVVAVTKSATKRRLF